MLHKATYENQCVGELGDLNQEPVTKRAHVVIFVQCFLLVFLKGGASIVRPKYYVYYVGCHMTYL